MTYTQQTTYAIVTATWRKDHFEILVEPAIGGFMVEWAYTLDYAAHRFQWLLARYT